MSTAAKSSTSMSDHHPNIFQENPYLIPSLIVLAAAIILSGALLARPTAQTTMGDMKLPNNFVPASTSSPAHLTPEKGQTNPSTTIPHYASYAPQPFTITGVSGNSITGTYVSDPNTSVTLSITSSTDIYGKGAMKSEADYEQELAAFQKKMQYADTNDIYVAPDKFVHTPLTLADLKTGMTVVVSSSDGKTADTVFVLE